MIKVRINGQIVHIPTIKGVDGKSAYQYAVEAGFEGTEQEFINLLIEGTDVINHHLTDETAHMDIRELIEESIKTSEQYTNKALSALTDGSTVVQKATEADHASIADSATKATQDAAGNVITETYETKTDAVSKLTEAKSYTDTKVADLVNSAPETLDTLGELAAAMQDNGEVVDALNEAITTKLNKDQGVDNAGKVMTVGEDGLLVPAMVPQADWNQTDETANDFIKNKPEIATDEEIINMLMEEDMFPIVKDNDGSILTDENGNILLW